MRVFTFLPFRWRGGPIEVIASWAGLLLLASQPGAAQAQAGVRGTVAAGAAGAVSFATIALHRAADSVVVKSEFSDERGGFLLEGRAGGRYLVSASQVGYRRVWSASFTLPPGGLELPALQLQISEAAALAGVTVQARQPLFEHHPDRTVVHVADSPLSAGATALDVLGRSPGVVVNEAIALRGRQGLLLLVDGKRLPLSGVDLAEYLRALPAEQLQTIELITNPPAEYDAQGGAGVIAITLKKDLRLGTNGTANASYGRGEYGKLTAGLTLNHRSKNANLYGSYSYANRNDFARQEFYRQYAALAGLPAASSEVLGKRMLYLRSHSAKVGADLSLTPRTLLGVGLTGLLSNTSTNNDTQTRLYDEGGAPALWYRSVAAQEIMRPNGSANLNLRNAFADSASAASLTADADYAHYRTTRALDLRTSFLEPTFAPALLTGEQRSDLAIGALKLDYSRPLPRRSRLDLGGKSTRVTSTSAVAFLENGLFAPSISSAFDYYENVNAGYASLRGGRGKTSLQAGLRAEQTTIRTTLAGEGMRERQYLQLFPTASVQVQLAAQHALALAAGRRIDRPNYAQLNPLRAYVDAVSYRSGNPYLVAQTSYNVDLTHTYRQKYSTALTYAHTRLPIVTVVQPAPDGSRQVVSREVNLTSQDYLAFTLTAPVEPTKWWTLYANAVFYVSRFRGELAGTLLDRQQPACQLTANNTFSLPHGWSGELNGSFQSGEIWGFERARPRGQLLLGLQRSFWAKQGTLRLNVSDVLYTSVLRSTSVYTSFSESFVTRQDTRVATAAFTYRFGNGKVAAARKRAAGAEDELRRAAGQ
ncbi:TonB-dependent receptor family protein [Hymenobacter sp. 5317J-9]|uniref:outer membrane beta-barrel family protein n=1 Tax=Hymenobacter sp. 5317J-9 TaxID=2932250 RepID=UPI001FD63C9C|nr:outer membrane beta-barrel family protein [Hymenobacter sp. 5317J-9]UOQ96076.1 TonB-dependent receptor family protein [Hymenobacter sp. 5317J-9]